MCERYNYLSHLITQYAHEYLFTFPLRNVCRPINPGRWYKIRAPVAVHLPINRRNCSDVARAN